MNAPAPRPSALDVWLAAIRPQTLTASLAPVAAGTALAAADGALRWGPACAALGGAIGIQVGTNLINDWSDFRKGADTDARLGPPRAAQQGWLTSRQILAAAVFSFALATAFGAYLVWTAGWPLLALGLVSIACGVAYTCGPYPLAYTGLAEPFVLAFFGVAAVSGTYYVQAAQVSPGSVLVGVALGLLATGILVVNNLRDRHTDAVAGKRTLAVRFGAGFARGEYTVCLALAFMLPVAASAAGLGHAGWLAPLIALPLAAVQLRGVWRRDGAELNQHLAGTARLELAFALLLALGGLAVVVIARAEVLSYRLPFQRELVTARTRRRERRGWLLRLEDETGRVGWGDAACWPGFGGGVAATRCALEALAAGLPGRELAAAPELREWIRPIAAPEAAHAVELAGLDLLARAAGRPLAHLLGDPRRSSVACQALVTDAEDAKRAVAAGYTTLKTKVGAVPPSQDDRRLAEIRDAVGDRPGLRLDANGAWSVSAALSCLDRFARHRPEWIEQPVAARDVDGLAWVRARSGVPVAADEAVRDEGSLRDLIDAEAVDVVVLKPMFLGGPTRCLELAALAHAAGCQVTLTHALESAVGRVGALHTAAALPQEAVCGLSNPLAEDVALPQPVIAGRLRLPAQPGLGIEVKRLSAHEEVEA